MRFDRLGFEWLCVGLAMVGLAGCGDDGQAESQQDDLLGKAEVLGPDPDGAPTRLPIVLAHGLGGSRDFLFFYRVADVLRSDGHLVYEGEVPPFQSAEIRAESLAETVD